MHSRGVHEHVPAVADEHEPAPRHPDDPDEAVSCTQAWVRVMGAQPTGGVTLFDGSDCAAVLRLQLEVNKCSSFPNALLLQWKT